MTFSRTDFTVIFPSKYYRKIAASSTVAFSAQGFLILKSPPHPNVAKAVFQARSYAPRLKHRLKKGGRGFAHGKRLFVEEFISMGKPCSPLQGFSNKKGILARAFGPRRKWV